MASCPASGAFCGEMHEPKGFGSRTLMSWLLAVLIASLLGWKYSLHGAFLASPTSSSLHCTNFHRFSYHSLRDVQKEGTLTLSCSFAWPLRLSFEIWLEASMTLITLALCRPAQTPLHMQC